MCELLFGFTVVPYDNSHSSDTLMDIIIYMNYELTPEGRARFGYKVLTPMPRPRTTPETDVPDITLSEDSTRRFSFLAPVRELVQRTLRDPEEPM